MCPLFRGSTVHKEEDNLISHFVHYGEVVVLFLIADIVAICSFLWVYTFCEWLGQVPGRKKPTNHTTKLAEISYSLAF